jgi:glycosyltransferase involved in cell wall biosynthesis/Tfp pilus assembly protein PilF
MNSQHSFNEDINILFVSHDAARAGSQILLLEIMEWIKQHTRIRFRILLINGGVLLDRFRDLADCLVVEEIKRQDFFVEELRKFAGNTVDLVYANTVVSGRILEYLQYLNCPVVTHVHELEKSIRRFAGPEVMAKTIAFTDKYIAASSQIKDNLVSNHGIDAADIHVVNAFIKPQGVPPTDTERTNIRKNLGLPSDQKLVFGCGTLDWRKGADIFVELASRIKKNTAENFHFYWIGPGGPDNYIDPGMNESGPLKTFKQYLAEVAAADTVSFLGEQRNPRGFFRAGDIFALPSREDPFPLVCLEAANCGLPVVCFEGVGGMPDFVEDDCGFVVPYPKVDEMAAKISQLMADTELCRKLGHNGFRKLMERHVVGTAVPEILNIVCSSSVQTSSKAARAAAPKQDPSSIKAGDNIRQLLQDAMAHVQAGHLTEAETAYQRVLALQPNHPGALHVLGLLKYQNGDRQRAIELIERAVAVKPDFADAYKNLANIYAELGQLDNAIAKYRQAIAITPDLVEAHVNLGLVYQSLQRLDEAKKHYEIVLSINPELNEVRDRLAEL